MILEIATIDIKPGTSADFEKNLELAQSVISRSPGYLGHQFQRCIEQENRYVLLIRWESLEAHTVGFRESELFKEWRGLIGQFFETPPAVQHFNDVGFGISDFGVSRPKSEIPNPKYIDLSVTISEEIKEPLPTKIIYEDHKEGAKKMGGKIFEGLSDVLIEGNGPAGEFLSVTSHCGTHVDAPWHYFPTCADKPSRTIDEMPLDWFFHDGVVLDFTDKPDGYMFEPEDLQEKLADIGYTLKPFDIVLIRCDADKRLHDPDYVRIHVGASAAATHWLIDRGIKVMGTDGWGWDIPLHIQAEDYRRNPRPGIIWQAHYVGIEKEYCQIEKLANLDQLPPFGFKVACFPAKIKGGSAGWTRAVAILED